MDSDFQEYSALRRSCQLPVFQRVPALLAIPNLKIASNFLQNICFLHCYFQKRNCNFAKEFGPFVRILIKNRQLKHFVNVLHKTGRILLFYKSILFLFFSQSEHPFPLWAERFVLGLSLCPQIDQLQNDERVTLAIHVGCCQPFRFIN